MRKYFIPATAIFTKAFSHIHLGLILVLFLTNRLTAQIPQGFNYQAVVRNSTGAIVPNQRIGVQFVIHNDSLRGNIAFRENDSISTNPEGIITVVIGAGNITAGSLGDVHWLTGNTFLQVGIDVTGGSSYVDMGTTQLVSVPYSLVSGMATTLALKEDSIPLQTGPFSFSVGNSGYISLGSNALPSGVTVNAISPGSVVGQVVVIKGSSPTVGNGVRFQTTTTNLNIGTSGGSIDLFGGSTLTLMWDGNKWIQLAYSKNN